MPNYISYGQLSLFAEEIQQMDVRAYQRPLQRIGQLIDWSMFAGIARQAVEKKSAAPGGRPRFDPLLMFKILVLQKIEGLADDATSFQIADRSSYRAFLGMCLTDIVPDGQTICDYRNALGTAGGFEAMFEVFLKHLQTQGLALAKQGVMVDATFVEVPVQRNTRAENEQIKAGEKPASIMQNQRVAAQKDFDATHTQKHGEKYFGFKDHTKVDVESKLIIDAVVTTASVHDSQVLGQLIKEGDKVCYADSAYFGKPIEEMLSGKKVEAQIIQRGVRNKELSGEEKENNREKSRVRSRVEHVYAQMTGSMKALWQRHIGMDRNSWGIIMTNLVYNLMRYEQIVRLNLVKMGVQKA